MEVVLSNEDPTTVSQSPALENVTESDWNSTMNSTSTSFIFTPYAYGISGVFVWSALFLTSFQVQNSV